MSAPSSLLAFLLFFGIYACQQRPPAKDLFPDAQTILLTGEGVTLKLPVGFVRSSPEQLMEDIPLLGGDTSFLKLVSVFFDGFGTRAQTLDLLVDTTSALRCLMITEGPHFEMNEPIGKRLNQELGDYFRKVDEADLFLDIHKIDSRLKGNDQIDFFKYKQEVVRTTHQESYYQTLYMLSIPNRSLLIIEFSIAGEDIEDYLWTIKN